MARQLVVFLALVGCALSVEIKEEKNVLVLTTKNFDEALAQHSHVLVEFYAPWCGHCKALAPEYASAAQQLAKENSEVRLAKVDATEETELGDKFKVQGYPTLKFFRNGKPTEYNGGRTAPEIVSWLKKKTGPPAVTLTDAETASKFVEDNEVAVIGFFRNKESSEAKAYLETATGIDDVNFAITHELSVAKEYKVKKEAAIVLLKKFDEGRNDFDGSFTVEEITTFIRGNQLPLVTEFTDETAPKIFGGDIKVHLLYFGPKSADTYEPHMEVLKKAAGAAKGKILFVTVDADKPDNERVMEFFSLKADETPAVRLVRLGEQDMKKYVPDEKGITQEVVDKFVKDYLDGNLKPHLNSQEIPDDWDAKPVKVLVGKNFHDVVVNNKKTVIVEFYAPWCGHCKQLAPTWDKLGEHFKDSDTVTVAKMDSTVNEIEDVAVQGFPTIYLWPSDSKDSPIQYDGPRTLEGLKRFTQSDGKEGNQPGGEDEAEVPFGEEGAPEGEEEDEEEGADLPEGEGEEDIPMEQSEDENLARDEL